MHYDRANVRSQTRRKVAIVIPDGLSAVLFCGGMIRAIDADRGSEVLVICDVGEAGAELEGLGARPVAIEMHRFLNPIADFGYIVRLFLLLRHEKCDAVINFSTKPIIYGGLAGWLCRVPLVVGHVVGRGSAFLETRSIRRRLLRSIVGLLYRVAAHCSDRLWFTNKNDLAYFSELGVVDDRKALLTRNYLDVGAYRPSGVSTTKLDALRGELGIDAKDRVVLMIGRLNWAKGVREFADAAQILRDGYPDAWFLLLAPPEEGSAGAIPTNYVRGREKDGRFRWLGFRRDVRTLIALCDIAVLPSYYREGGYPRGLLEPMAMGKPIIAADTVDCRGPVIPERNGILVPPRDAAALADAIGRLLRDGDLRRAFGQEGRRLAEELFDEGVIVPQALRELGVISGGRVASGSTGTETSLATEAGS